MQFRNDNGTLMKDGTGASPSPAKVLQRIPGNHVCLVSKRSVWHHAPPFAKGGKGGFDFVRNGIPGLALLLDGWSDKGKSPAPHESAKKKEAGSHRLPWVFLSTRRRYCVVTSYVMMPPSMATRVVATLPVPGRAKSCT